MNVPMPQTGSSWVWEVESVVVLVSARGDAESLVHRVALLNGELVEARRAWDVARERVYRLSRSSVEGARQLMASKMKRQEQFVELSLLQSWCVELCLSILGP
jgi:hypothetical protein